MWKGKGWVSVKGRGFLRWGIKKASVASVGVFFLAALFVRTAWAQGAVTDDADFFKYNPYLGYELHTYGFTYVTGWKGTAQDIFDSILKEYPYDPVTFEKKPSLVRPIFDLPVEWRSEWEEADRLRLIFGAERSVYLWVLHLGGDDQGYEKYIEMQIQVLDQDKKKVTEILVRPNFTFSGDPLWEKGEDWVPPPPSSAAVEPGKFGFPDGALLTLTPENIADIKAALKRQGTNRLYFSVSANPNEAYLYQYGYPKWLPWGFSLWELKGNRVPTWDEARKGQLEVVQHLEDISRRVDRVYAVADDLSAELFVNEKQEFLASPWLELFEMIPVEALMHGEYKHQPHQGEAVPDSDHGRIKEHGVITRIPGRKKYNTDFPDKIVLDYAYYLRQEKLRKESKE